VTSSFINDSWVSAGGANNASLPVIHKVTFDYLKSFAKRSVLVQCSGQSFLQASASLLITLPDTCDDAAARTCTDSISSDGS
jgi:hypothetical protein